jgi:4-hydroxythreonine-4-phosphate dehydrogenase
MADLPPIAVTLGDPAGVGPEVTARAWEARGASALPAFFAVGDAAAVAQVWDGPIERVNSIDGVASAFSRALPVWQVEDSGPPEPGVPTTQGALCALHALECGIGFVRTGAAAALVTGPISKREFHAIGYTHPGQTEFIAERCGITAANAVMMLAAPGLRVVPLTVHIPLAEIPAALTPELIVARARVAARGLARDFGIAAPRLAIAGLNPHAGEGGQLGREECDVIAPAAAQLASEGIAIDGPIAADALFAPHIRSRYDALLCAYHDQALAPFKAMHFHDGVNLTLGLPIVRTSPDHGTAFNIAGRREADPGPTIAAIALAGTMAAARRRAAEDADG